YSATSSAPTRSADDTGPVNAEASPLTRPDPHDGAVRAVVLRVAAVFVVVFWWFDSAQAGQLSGEGGVPGGDAVGVGGRCARRRHLGREGRGEGPRSQRGESHGGHDRAGAPVRA